MTTLEKEIEAKLRQMVKRHRGMCLKWVCPGWVGVPDRMILLPGGRIMFAELKRPKGGRLSTMQKWWRKKLTELGFDCWFVFDENDIKTVELVILDTLGGAKQ